MEPTVPASHLDAALLAALARREVSEAARVDAERHLAGCTTCRGALAGLSQASESVLDTIARVSPAAVQVQPNTPTALAADVRAGTPVGRPGPPSGSASDLPFFQPGLVAGKFRPLRVIGAGGMGVVVAAEHVQLHQRVALKFMQPEIVGHAEATGRFLREARAAASLRSEHVCRVLDLGELEGGLPYIVMEYLEGESLEALLARRGPLPSHEVATHLIEALEAIGEAHGRGIVHRDLKPGNLWLTARPEGRARVKVLDFGISKAPRTDPQHGVTSANALLGTPLYMAPEQLFAPSEVDGRSDLWAVGCILYQLTTGALPFEGSSFADLCNKVRNTAPKPPRALRPELPTAFEAVVLRCLEREPGKRPQSAAELAELLRPLQVPTASEHAAAARAPVATDAEPPRSKPRARPVVLATALTALLGAAMGGGAVMLWLGRAEPRAVATAPAAPARVEPSPPAPVPAPRAEPVVVAAPVVPAPPPTTQPAGPAKVVPLASPAEPASHTPPKHSAHRTARVHAASSSDDDDVFGKR